MAYQATFRNRHFDWSKVTVEQARQMRKADVEVYAKSRGLIVRKVGNTAWVGVGFGRSYRAALVDLLEHEAGERGRAA